MIVIQQIVIEGRTFQSTAVLAVGIDVSHDLRLDLVSQKGWSTPCLHPC